MATTNFSPSANPAGLDALVAEYYERFQPADHQARFWVAMMIRADWRRRALERRVDANERNFEHAKRELETRQGVQPAPAPVRRLELVPPRVPAVPVSNSKPRRR